MRLIPSKVKELKEYFPHIVEELKVKV